MAGRLCVGDRNNNGTKALALKLGAFSRLPVSFWVEYAAQLNRRLGNRRVLVAQERPRGNRE
jgi:hypothetical protein